MTKNEVQSENQAVEVSCVYEAPRKSLRILGILRVLCALIALLLASANAQAQGGGYTPVYDPTSSLTWLTTFFGVIAVLAIGVKVFMVAKAWLGKVK